MLLAAFAAGMLLPEVVLPPEKEAAERLGQLVDAPTRVPLAVRAAEASARARRSAGLPRLAAEIQLALHELTLNHSMAFAAAAGIVRKRATSPQEADRRSVPSVASGVNKSNRLKRELLIGVLTDPYSLSTIGLAGFSTWGQEVGEFATLIFFVGSCEANTSFFPGTVVCLDTPDTYPPQKKVFLMWSYLWRNRLHDHRWFMKVDHDTYVNAPSIQQLIGVVSSVKYSEQCAYVGMPAVGRSEERVKLGLSGRPYCSGLGYAVNGHCLSTVGPYFGQCLDGVVSNHSDTEFGRCIMRYANAECTAVSSHPFVQIYYQQEGSMVYPMRLVKGGQMTLIFQREPKAEHFAATLLHPLKRAEDFYRFHKQSMSGLRPVQAPISIKSEPGVYRRAIADLRKSCVHNTQRQRQRGKFALAECAPPAAEEQPNIPLEAFVITQAEFSAEKSFLEVAEVLGESSIKAIHVPVVGWKGAVASDIYNRSSETAYLNAVYGILRNATKHETRRLLIFDERIMFLCSFKDQLWQLLNSQRCGGHLFTKRRGGVLLLGAEEASSSGLAIVEADRSDAFAGSGDVSAAMCYNVYEGFEGSFAGLYHRTAFNEILSWISRVRRAGSPAKFHMVYPHLSDKGYIVRASFPNLVLRKADNDPLKEVDALDSQRIAVRLRWYEGKYCGKGGHPIYNVTS